MHAFQFVVPALLALTVAISAEAAQRTFVATTGNDTNLCTLLAPCRSFAAAMPYTDPEGEIIVLDSGAYGRVTITQPVTIEAPAGVYAGISVFASTNGIDVNAPGATVTLRGLSINGQGGISASTSPPSVRCASTAVESAAWGRRAFASRPEAS
jgi:hypothetical protein